MARRQTTFVTCLVAVALTALACKTSPPQVTPKPATAQTATIPNLYDVQKQIADYIESGRYEADVAKVADEARAWIEQRAKTATRPAIVLDIDETSLSNWPAYRVNG